MDEQQARLDLVLVADTIDTDADSPFMSYLTFDLVYRKAKVLPAFLCQFSTKVNDHPRWREVSTTSRERLSSATPAISWVLIFCTSAGFNRIYYPRSTAGGADFPPYSTVCSERNNS